MRKLRIVANTQDINISERDDIDESPLSKEERLRQLQEMLENLLTQVKDSIAGKTSVKETMFSELPSVWDEETIGSELKRITRYYFEGKYWRVF